jgi:phosphate starvation-inducible PhoH-like protein
MTRKRRQVKESQKEFQGVYLKQFEPKTSNQHDYIRSVAENTISYVNGCAGTGKTYQAIGWATQALYNGLFKHVLYARTIISCGGTLGFLPGTVDEKCEVYFRPALDYYEHFIGAAKRDELIKRNVLKFFPVELIKGYTHTDTLMILDEAQNVDEKQMKLFLTRMGKGSKAIILGDTKQSDIGRNGFSFCLNTMGDVQDVGIVNLGKEDILRHPLLAHVIEVFEKHGI